MAHRFEISLKDGLNSTLFKDIDELLMHVYYVYKNHLKSDESWRM